MLTIGWALVYWPWMPAGFLHTAELDAPGSSLHDSLYFSLVTLATLGYGDISPLSGWLRVVAPLESLLGLGLLTGSVSWLLSIFPVLARRRALAYEIHLLEEVRIDPDDPGPPSPLPSSVYADLTSRLVASERDLVTFPITYYFHDDDIRFALPAAMEHLLELAEEARRQVNVPEVHFHGGLLLRAIDDFAASIAERFHLPNRGCARDVLQAYARDHATGSRLIDTRPGDHGAEDGRNPFDRGSLEGRRRERLAAALPGGAAGAAPGQIARSGRGVRPEHLARLSTACRCRCRSGSAPAGRSPRRPPRREGTPRPQ